MKDRHEPSTSEMASDTPSISGEVVIVSGLPRSGTSMLMQMLVAYGLTAFTDGEREADPSNPRGYYEHEKVKGSAQDARWVSEAKGHVVKVVAPLLPSLPSGPRYRVVFIERDINEVLRSQAVMLERKGVPPAPEASLRAAYRRHLREAKAWLESNAEALYLNHAAVLNSPREAAVEIDQFLGHSGDLDAMAATIDPALHRQRA